MAKIKTKISSDPNDSISENKNAINLKKDDNKELINRLNRAIGQLNAIKKRLESQNENDCVQTMRLLKAANNAIKKFGEAYVSQHLSSCINNGISAKEIEKGLKDVIGSVFSMS